MEGEEEEEAEFFDGLQSEWLELWHRLRALQHLHLKGCAQGAFAADTKTPAKLQRLTLENMECLTPQLHLPRGCLLAKGLQT